MAPTGTPHEEEEPEEDEPSHADFFDLNDGEDWEWAP